MDNVYIVVYATSKVASLFIVIVQIVWCNNLKFNTFVLNSSKAYVEPV